MNYNFFRFISVWPKEPFVLNKGFPGNNVFDLKRRLKVAVLHYNPSLVIIMIGTNDMINPAKMLSYSAFKHTLEIIVKRILSTGAEVLLLSVPHVDAAYVSARHNPKKYFILPNERIDFANVTIERMAVNQSCLFLDVNVVFKRYHSPDRTSSSLIRNKENSGCKDGVHPTSTGYRIIAENVAAFIQQQGKKYTRIICFGDSITFGAYSRGMGTSKGRTYPAVLRKLLFGGNFQV